MLLIFGTLGSIGDGLDIAIDFGTLGSIGDGLMTPLTMLVLSGLINEYRGTSGISFSIEIVNKVCKLTAVRF